MIQRASFFKKKRSSYNLPLGLWRVLQDEEKKGHDLGPFFTNQKIVLSSTANRAFSRTCKFEVKAKDFTIEAKAKNFKICFSGRHRELHLRIIAMLFKIRLIFFWPKSQKNLHYFCISHFAIEWDVFKQNHVDHR